MRDQRTGASVFVKIDDYKEILDVLDMINSKIKDIKATLSSLNALRNEEDSEITMWNSAINDIERKIESIDKIMFEPEHTS